MKKSKKIFLIICMILDALNIALYLIYADIIPYPYLSLVPAFVLSLVICYMLGFNIFLKKKNHEIFNITNKLNTSKELVNSLLKNNDTVLNELPVGIIVYNEEMIVSFSNKKANDFFQIESLLFKDVKHISKDLYEIIEKRDESGVVKIYSLDLSYKIVYESRTIYLFDSTESIYLKDKLNIVQPVFGVISIDGLDETLNDGYDLKERTELLGKYFHAIENFKEKFNLYSFSSLEEKIFIIFNNDSLEKLKNDGFRILREFEEISEQNATDISLTIGIGCGSFDYELLGRYANEALETAVSRGGSQAVVFDGKQRISYGGKGESTERIGRITSRIFASKLKELIENSISVVIMPHIDTDMDSFGSALALNELCEKLNTPCKICLNETRIDTTVKKIINASTFECVKLRNILISPSEVDSYIDDKSLLIVVDHHQQDLSVCKSAYKKAKKMVVIDHHRLTDKLELNPVIQHIDHAASSTIEIVLELISLLDLDIEFTSFLSTSMYVGMLIDTNNFSLHMSSRTFDALSFLMKNDADPYKAKMYVRESVESQIEKAKILESAEIEYDRFAILCMDNDERCSKEKLAKAAETLLLIDSAEATFAIGYLDNNTVGISARSGESFNVAIEMERLGGGGHYNMGATQLKDRTIIDVKEELIQNLGKTIKGDKSTMKVILIEDVKKQGKKGDVLDCAPGYAQYLLSKKFAIEANSDNMAQLDLEKANEAKRQKEEKNIALKLKELLEKTTVDLKVKLGDNGKFFGSISTKMIADELSSTHKIDIDKRKIELPDEKIDSLGTYNCTIKLHKEVTAILKFNVKE